MLCSDLLEVLDAHRDNCERLGKYVEAEIARKRIDELKGHEEARRKEAMRARQLAEVLAVEEGHMMEFQQFNAMWDAKMAAYETNGGQLIQAMRVRDLLAPPLPASTQRNPHATIKRPPPHTPTPTPPHPPHRRSATRTSCATSSRSLLQRPLSHGTRASTTTCGRSRSGLRTQKTTRARQR